MTDRWNPAMRSALAEAAKCGEDVPVGAVLVDAEGNVVAVGRNDKELHNDPTGHAEIVAIREAAKARGTWRLDDLTLVVTLEPCVMCAGAIVAARIPRVVFGAWDSRVGASGSLYDLLRDGRLGTPVEVISGVLETECAEVLTQFFESRRMSGSK
jgi:tRNA(adenine34) deaminase